MPAETGGPVSAPAQGCRLDVAQAHPVLHERAGVYLIGISGDPGDTNGPELTKTDTQVVVMALPELRLQFGSKLLG